MTEQAHDAARDMVGAVIEGRYRLAARLGDGAVGSVYRAEDVLGGAPLAVKIWRSSVLDGQAAGRFHRETKALVTLEHPRIVAIRDYGLIEGLPYLAMELLAGESLADRIERAGRLPPRQAIAILAQVLDALGYAHSRNVVHRDLKPENIFLVSGNRPQPEVKLLDYGLAKFLTPADDPVQGALLTRKGMMVGTPLYVAPEQALGGKIDTRADLYSVGCVLFEMLTGQPPFWAEKVEDLLRAHLVAPVPRLASLVPELEAGDALQALLERAMAKSVNERFATAEEMARALPFQTAAQAPAPGAPRPGGVARALSAPQPARVPAAAPVAEPAGWARRGGLGALIWPLVIALGIALLWLLR